MASVPGRLLSFLDENGVTFDLQHYPLDYTAQEKAADTHTPGIEFAKTVLLGVDDDYVMAVLPAHHRVDLEQMRTAVGASRVRLAAEDETAPLFPDCEVGAEPPFGNLYNLPCYLSRAMADDEHITFSAGTHEDVIRMAFLDYEMLAQPEVMEFTCAI